MSERYEWAPEPPPVFTRHDDGSIAADRFPPRILITGELLRFHVVTPALHRRFRTVTFRTSKGNATYRLVRRWKEDGYVTFGARRTAGNGP